MYRLISWSNVDWHIDCYVGWESIGRYVCDSRPLQYSSDSQVSANCWLRVSHVSTNIWPVLNCYSLMVGSRSMVGGHYFAKGYPTDHQQITEISPKLSWHNGPYLDWLSLGLLTDVLPILWPICQPTDNRDIYQYMKIAHDLVADQSGISCSWYVNN